MVSNNCSSEVLIKLCSIGGRCVFNAVTSQEECLCNPGFGPDFSVLHNEISDCSVPQSAYLGWLLFQTLGNSVVLYRLIKQTRTSKGKIKQLNLAWSVALVASWAFVIGLTTQNGMYEVGSIALMFSLGAVTFAAFALSELFIEARYAVEMRSADIALRVVLATKYLFIGLGLSGCVVQLIYCRSDQSNYVGFALLSHIIVFGLSSSSIILYHNLLLARTLQGMMRATVSGDALDEKPALLKRLSLFRHIVFVGNIAVTFPIFILLGVFTAQRAFPLMWVLVLLAWQFFPVTGLVLNHLNTLIQTFKFQKIRMTEARNVAATTPSSSIIINNNNMLLAISAPFFNGRRVLSKLHYVQMDRSVFTTVFGMRFARLADRIAFSVPFRLYIAVTGPLMMILSVLLLLNRGIYSVIPIIAAGAWTLLVILFVGIAGTNQKVAGEALLQSAPFQLRLILLLAATMSAAATLDWSLRSLIIALLDLCAFLFFLLDCYRKECRRHYEQLIFFLSSSVPFFVWFILAFDLLDGRINHTFVTSGYVWSVYHFTMDAHAFVMWCVFMDAIRLIKNSTDNYMLLTCPLVVRVVKMTTRASTVASTASAESTMDATQLGATSASTTTGNKSAYKRGKDLDEGEVDFSSGDTRQNNIYSRSQQSQSQGGVSPAPSVSPLVAAVRRNTEVLMSLANQSYLNSTDTPPQPFVTSIVIREDDAFLTFFLAPNLCMSLLRFHETHCLVLNTFSGLIVGGAMGIWAGTVLGGTAPEYLSIILLAIMLVPLGWRFLFKSSLVTVFLLKRLEFFYDSSLLATILAFCGISLKSTPLGTIPGLMGMACIFLDWRFSDALVLPRHMSPYLPTYFVPVFIGFLCLPALVFGGFVPNVSVKTFVLVDPLNATLLEGIDDMYAEQYPPYSSLSRIRYSQIAFDAMFAFGVKLVLDFVQHLCIGRHRPGLVVLDYIRCTVAPHSVAELPHTINDPRPFWDPAPITRTGIGAGQHLPNTIVEEDRESTNNQDDIAGIRNPEHNRGGNQSESAVVVPEL